MPTNEQKEIVRILLDRPAIKKPKADFEMRFLLEYVEGEFAARKKAATREELSEMVTSFFEDKNSGQ